MLSVHFGKLVFSDGLAWHHLFYWYCQVFQLLSFKSLDVFINFSFALISCISYFHNFQVNFYGDVDTKKMSHQNVFYSP